MGKYMIRVESMDGNDLEVDERFGEGIECDGFCVLAQVDDKNSTVAIHNMNIDGISDVIKGNSHVLAAGILAKAKKDVVDVCKDGERMNVLRELLGMS